MIDLSPRFAHQLHVMLERGRHRKEGLYSTHPAQKALEPPEEELPRERETKGEMLVT